MTMEEILSQHAQGILKGNPLSRLRGVTAEWLKVKTTTLLIFYFDGEPLEGEIEEASVYATEIIAGIPEGFLEERYLRWDYPKSLPKSKFWVYRREEI